VFSCISTLPFSAWAAHGKYLEASPFHTLTRRLRKSWMFFYKRAWAIFLTHLALPPLQIRMS
jgi:hypothetical protein